MKHIPFFRFYPADFMNGVRGLSPQEVGVYTMLLCRIYEENGPVEYHPLRLATYCGMRESSFVKTLEKLVELGKLTLAEGRLSNARAETEISNRANDLKNASKAGKASAKKRQEKQAGEDTGVERPFNHTDTDTDTYVVDKSTTPAAADSRREAILEIMGCDPRGITPDGRFTGTTADMAELPKWDGMGLTRSEQDGVIRDMLAKARSKNPQFMPGRWSWFTAGMADLRNRKCASGDEQAGNAAVKPEYRKAEHAERDAEIRKEWQSLVGKDDPDSMARKQELARQLAKLKEEAAA